MMAPHDHHSSVFPWAADAALVRGLMHRRAGRQRYARVLPVHAEKLLMTLTAGAAWAGFSLVRLEDDGGMEILVATRGAVTLTFENPAQVASWLSHAHAHGMYGHTAEAYAP